MYVTGRDGRFGCASWSRLAASECEDRKAGRGLLVSSGIRLRFPSFVHPDFDFVPENVSRSID